MNPRFTACLCAAVLLCPPAFASDNTGQAMRELIEVLRAEGAISQTAYEALKRTLEAAPEPAEPAPAPVARAPEPAAPQINTKGRLEIKSADGDFRFRLGGRLHYDGNWYRDRNDVDFGSGTQLRRARLETEGTLWGHWDFKFQYDFTGSGRAGVQDGYLKYTGFDATSIRLGHFKEPLGLEVVTGANNLSFIERALPGVLAPSRSVGLAVSRQIAEQFTATLGVFGEGISKLDDSSSSTTPGLDEGWAVTGRLTWVPVRSDTSLLHFGAAASFRKANDFGGTQTGTPFRVRQRPEASVSSIRLIDTGELSDVDDLLTWGVEAAWIGGPFSLQAEYLSMEVNRDLAGASDPTFSGYYIMGSWMLTGESRRYSFADGTFSNPRVKSLAGRGGIGAWELVSRFSHLDLTDNLGRPGAVIGGEESNFTLGMNWYPNDNLRFMFNWVKVLDLDRPSHVYDGTEPSIYLLRGQVIW